MRGILERSRLVHDHFSSYCHSTLSGAGHPGHELDLHIERLDGTSCRSDVELFHVGFCSESFALLEPVPNATLVDPALLGSGALSMFLGVLNDIEFEPYVAS